MDVIGPNGQRIFRLKRLQGALCGHSLRAVEVSVNACQPVSRFFKENGIKNKVLRTFS